VYSPGVSSDVIGPFRPAAFLTAYGFLALPNVFVATAIQFALALRSGRAMASYVGSMFLVFMGFFVASLLLFRRGLGTLLDPIGIRFVVEDLAHSWTTTEKSTRLFALEGAVLTNRLLWVGIALGVVAVTYLRFRFVHRTVTAFRVRRAGPRAAQAPVPAGIGVVPSAPIVVPQIRRTFGFAMQARKTLAIAWVSFRTIAASWAGLAMLIGIPLLSVLVVIDQMEAIGAPLMPTTARVLTELTGSLTVELSRWVIIPLLMVFFAGELVWREREAGLDEINDAMPGSEWVPFAGKFLGLGLLLVVFLVLLMAAGMLAQVMMGYRNFEIGLYLKILMGLQLPEYLLFTLLALAVHVLVNQKYGGHLVAIVTYAFIAVLAGALGIEHNLLVYGAGPGWAYTEMRGFGPFIGPWAWFKLYWGAWALLLAVLARLLWVRGKEGGLGVRLLVARRRFTRSTALAAGTALALILTLGGFIFYNTNVVNRYRDTAGTKERRAEYERRYGRFEHIPQPQLTGTNLRVEIHPDRQAVEITGAYRLVNESAVAIESVHVATAIDGAVTRSMTFDRPTALAIDDPEHGYRIYALATPLLPADTLRLDFEVRVESRGFSNRGVDPSVVANGTYFTNAAWFPFVGYQRQRELLTAADRREYGLRPRAVIASLYETEGREPTARGGGIAFEAVVGTREDQVAVAPGALRRTWTEGGRRYSHYATDAPIGSEWAFFSANYAVHEGRWNAGAGGEEVAIRIFHHPNHQAHLARMMRSVRASLDYYTRQFGPYPYGHLSIVENPAGPGTGMHAEASMISHGQGVPFWIPRDERNSLDFPFAVMAHEMAHQWGVPYAAVEGAPFLSEGLAWYSAMQVVKESRGEEELRRLLSFMRQPYPHRPIRRGEPLLRALDPYMSYRKGPFAMYALSEYAGADRVNGALRRLIEKHDSAGAPRATTLDLYRELQSAMPDSLEYLLHDLFEVNTYWQLATAQVRADSTSTGEWQVTLDVRARKVVFDSAGVETEQPIDEWLPIGVFGAAREGAGELSQPLYLRMHRLRAGQQTITVTVPRKPVLAGIDPFHVLDWEESDDDDNISEVRTAR
jgi:ABC-2 type transport system permease protein